MSRTGDTSEGDVSNFVLYASKIFNACRGRFAAIHAASSYRLMDIEVGVVRSNPMIPKTVEHTTDRRERIGYSRVQLIGELAPGAYWGMMLGESMVDRLGGLDRVEKVAPVYSTQRLEHGAILLRATATPVPLTDPELQLRLPRIEEFIDPIAVPIGPYFREIFRGA